VNTNTTTKQRNRGGRPPLKNWQAERDSIQLLLNVGYGVVEVAKHYHMSVAGARVVMRRLGLKTLWQQRAEKAG
jgi:hypothetical protein